MTDEVKRKIPFETRLNCFKERVVDFFKNEYRNPNGNEDCIEVCIIRDGYRTVLSLEEEINRQKAEVDRLREGIKFERERVDNIPNLLLQAQSEARKEFAERLTTIICEKLEQSLDNPDGDNYYVTDVYTDIDNLLKEMEGE